MLDTCFVWWYKRNGFTRNNDYKTLSSKIRNTSEFKQTFSNEEIPYALIQIIKHYEVAKQNEPIVDIVCFLGKQELGFRGYFEEKDSISQN